MTNGTKSKIIWLLEQTWFDILLFFAAVGIGFTWWFILWLFQHSGYQPRAENLWH